MGEVAARALTMFALLVVALALVGAGSWFYWGNGIIFGVLGVVVGLVIALYSTLGLYHVAATA